MPASAPTDLRETVMRIIAEQTAVAPERIHDETRIVEDLHLDGDDVVELMERVAATFAIDMSGYRWYHHHGPEGCNPFWLIFRPWWMRKTHIPIRVAVLVEAARTRTWPITYPESDREA
jgi:acyl carrier protein